MKSTSHHDERIAKMTFASVYPHYVTKVEKKGRSTEELHQVIQWLTGYDEPMLQKQIEEKATFEQFFQQAKPSKPASCSTAPSSTKSPANPSVATTSRSWMPFTRHWIRPCWTHMDGPMI